MDIIPMDIINSNWGRICAANLLRKPLTPLYPSIIFIIIEMEWN